MTDSQKNLWMNTEYKMTEIDNSITRIGGIPSYSNKVKVFDWPFYTSFSGKVSAMKFLGQLNIQGDLIYLFLGASDPTIGEDFYEYENGQSASFVTSIQKWSPWVTIQKICSITEEMLWSPYRAVTPIANIPKKPYFINENPLEGSDYKFLFQVPEEPGGLEGINIDMETYVYQDRNNNILMFNQTY